MAPFVHYIMPLQYPHSRLFVLYFTLIFLFHFVGSFILVSINCKPVALFKLIGLWMPSSGCTHDALIVGHIVHLVSKLWIKFYSYNSSILSYNNRNNQLSSPWGEVILLSSPFGNVKLYYSSSLVLSWVVTLSQCDLSTITNICLLIWIFILLLILLLLLTSTTLFLYTISSNHSTFYFRVWPRPRMRTVLIERWPSHNIITTILRIVVCRIGKFGIKIYTKKTKFIQRLARFEERLNYTRLEAIELNNCKHRIVFIVIII